MNIEKQIKIPKSHERFKQLLPNDGFGNLKPNDFKEMLKIIHNEPNKRIKNEFFTQIIQVLFFSGWGWYSRLGQALYKMPEIQYAYQLPETTRKDALSVLRMVKNMHIELKYRPSYIQIINSYIKEFGGKTLTNDQIAEQKNAKFNKAISKLNSGEKLPRKIKKMIQNQR